MKISKFLISSSGWAYKNLSKMAASYGGPQKLLDAVYNAGQMKVVALEIGGLVGGLVGAVVGEVVTGAPLLKRKAKSDTNSYINCPECGTRFEHRYGISLGCPNCNWNITDQEIEDGAICDEV